MHQISDISDDRNLAMGPEQNFSGNYFAFVESIEPLPVGAVSEPNALSAEFRGLVEMRREFNLEQPTHSVWLDCVDAEYFMGQEWTNERLDDKNPVRREERRRNIQTFGINNTLTVIQVLLSVYDKREYHQITRLSRTQWHHVSIGDNGQNPVLVANDFSSFEAQTNFLFLEQVTMVMDEARRLLYNVFNVDFIEEMQGRNLNDLGPRGGGAPIIPGGNPGDDLQLEAIELEEEQNSLVSPMQQGLTE